MAPTIHTAAGSFRGWSERFGEMPVHRFRGISYAEPPTGRQRFAAPVAARPLATGEVADATDFGATPPQGLTPLIERLGMTPLAPADEDCLSLNVDAPASAGSPRPVLFWIHGGAFITGTGASLAYDGLRLAGITDCVVVTFNYRVGALGFLYLEGDEGEDAPACANLGLLDQVVALEWVRAHIGAFGGDPDRITIFGESAGAGSICALLAMPRARGLFAGAIVQSAAPDGFLDPEEAKARTAQLLEILGVPAGGLRDVPVEVLVEAQTRCAGERAWRTGMFFTPVIDGHVLPRRPLEVMAAGEMARVPLVIGTTRDELQLYKYGTPAVELAEEALAGILAGQLPPPLGGDPGRARALVSSFREARAKRGESVDGIDLLYAVQTDLSMRVPAIEMAECFAEAELPVWMYLFEWRSPLEAGALGACHALDCPFVFGTLEEGELPELVGEGAAPRAVSDAMIGAWARFAHQARPGGSGPDEWPVYDAVERSTMGFGERIGARSAPLEAERRAIAALSREGAAPA